MWMLRQIAWEFSWIDRIRQGKPIVVCGQGEALHQHLHVEDAARGFAQVLGQAQCLGQTYNLVGEPPLTWAAHHRTAMEVLGREVALIGARRRRASRPTAGDSRRRFLRITPATVERNSAAMSPRSTPWWPYPMECARSLQRWSARGEFRGRRVRGGKMPSLPGTSSRPTRGQGKTPRLTGGTLAERHTGRVPVGCGSGGARLRAAVRRTHRMATASESETPRLETRRGPLPGSQSVPHAPGRRDRSRRDA